MDRKPRNGKLRRALFPVSVDSSAFSTERVLEALDILPSYIDELTFLIADRLQLYNKVSAVEDSRGVPGAIISFAETSSYLEERRTWLSRILVRSRPQIADAYRIIGVDDVSDRALHSIFRNVLVAFHSLPSFRADVELAAAAHVAKTRTVSPESAVGLAATYILEEIALNVRIHVGDAIQAEFYMGDYPVSLLGVYTGRYGISASTLANVDKADDFAFFSIRQTDDGPVWRAVIDAH